MDEEMYPETEPQTPAQPESETPEKGGEEEGETALIAKSIFGGKVLKPGDKVTFKIADAYDDEYGVELVDSEEESEPNSANDEIDEMAAQNEV